MAWWNGIFNGRSGTDYKKLGPMYGLPKGTDLILPA